MISGAPGSALGPLRRTSGPSAIALGLFSSLLACREGPGERLSDGGGFVLPDSGLFIDGGYADAAPGDSGPFVCNPACGASLVCGCPGPGATGCGCNPPGGHLDGCDPQVPASCASPTACVPARQIETAFVCSDGREGSPCSHAMEVCTTALGCVCLTNELAETRCSCTSTVGPSPRYCDRMVPASCPNGTCVRVEGTHVYFLCSDGSEGQPCEVGDGSCRTSVGCSCPLRGSSARCSCAEPAGAGEPCDPGLPGACEATLECIVFWDPESGGAVSRCVDGSSMSPDMCDPMDPEGCPDGYMCAPRGGGYRCVPV